MLAHYLVASTTTTTTTTTSTTTTTTTTTILYGGRSLREKVVVEIQSFHIGKAHGIFDGSFNIWIGITMFAPKIHNRSAMCDLTQVSSPILKLLCGL